MTDNFDVVVVGGGASGLAAGVEAARRGASVLVLEKNHVPGRKVLSTGSGKCNFSNASVSPSDYRPGAAPFLGKVFGALPPAGIVSFFEELGLLWSADDKGRLFPRSMKAQDVVSSLANDLASRGGQLRTLTEVSALRPGKGGFTVEAFRVPPQWERKARGEKLAFHADRVILAAGGPCYPQIGGTAAGFELLRALGHTVSAPVPVMVPLKSPDPLLKQLDGVRADAVLTLREERKELARSEGELLFTSYGLSGPAVLGLSRAAVFALRSARPLLEADLFPEMTERSIAALFRKRSAAFAGRAFRHFACGIHNEKIMKAAAARLRLDWNSPAAGEMKDLAALLKRFSFPVSGALGFGEAMVCAGGAALSEIDPLTFASKRVKGLFITGELLDLDGNSGGYNLHLAWTSGILAGRSAADRDLP